MAAGDTDVQIATDMTEAAIKTAVDAAITATGVAARLTIAQINNGNIVVVANLVA